MDNIDWKFVKRAEKVTSFNLDAKDFTVQKNKESIQHIFNKHFFPKFDLSKTLDRVDATQLNRLISELRSENPAMLQAMHFYNLKGVGPGEVLIYFLVKNGFLGGGSSSGVDFITPGKGYEIKAVEVNQAGYATNFKVGGTFDLSPILRRATELKKLAGAGGEGVNLSAIKLIKQKIPGEWEKVDKAFVELTYDKYFQHHHVIFMNNRKNAQLGAIEAIKQVKREDIVLERITSGTAKPAVKI